MSDDEANVIFISLFFAILAAFGLIGLYLIKVYT